MTVLWWRDGRVIPIAAGASVSISRYVVVPAAAKSRFTERVRAGSEIIFRSGRLYSSRTPAGSEAVRCAAVAFLFNPVNFFERKHEQFLDAGVSTLRIPEEDLPETLSKLVESDAFDGYLRIYNACTLAAPRRGPLLKNAFLQVPKWTPLGYLLRFSDELIQEEISAPWWVAWTLKERYANQTDQEAKLEVALLDERWSAVSKLRYGPWQYVAVTAEYIVRAMCCKERPTASGSALHPWQLQAPVIRAVFESLRTCANGHS